MHYGDIEMLGLDEFDEDEDIELLGDEDEDDDDDVGFRLMIPTRGRPTRTRYARTRGGRRVRVRQSPRAAKLQAVRSALVPRTPGSPRPGVRVWALGFPVVTFTAASGTTLRAQTNPQRAFKGSRLVVDVARTGATATGLISVGPIFVGQVNQLVSAQAVGAGTYRPDAVQTSLSLDPATPGVNITVDYTNSVVPTAPDQIDIGTSITGIAMGG